MDSYDDDEIKNEIISISSRLYDLIEQKRKSTTTFENLSIGLNQIRDSILKLIDQNVDSLNVLDINFHEQKKTIKHIFIDDAISTITPMILVAGLLFVVYTIYFLIQFFSSSFSYENEAKVAPSTKLASSLVSIHRFTGYDNSGKSSNYISYIVRGFSWKKNETELGKRHNSGEDVCSFIISNGVITQINNDELKGIICFGNASYEEVLSIPFEERLRIEEDRAKERSIILSECIYSNMKISTPIHSLNLGKSQEISDNSEHQRQILVIGIKDRKIGVIEEEALFNGLVNEFEKDNINIDIRTFSKVKATNRLKINRYYN